MCRAEFPAGPVESIDRVLWGHFTGLFSATPKDNQEEEPRAVEMLSAVLIWVCGWAASAGHRGAGGLWQGRSRGRLRG